ncbi:MAG: hypothetical protein AAFR56_11510, partial [Chloroflexota bacterium]
QNVDVTGRNTMKRKKKRNAVSRMMQIWLKENGNGKLAYDQWMELVTLPLLPMLLAALPVIVLFAFSPVGTLSILRVARYGGAVIVIVLAAIGGALVVRGIRMARMPVYQGELYAERSPMLISRFHRTFVMYTAKGDPITFDNALRGKPELVPDEPYVVHYLEYENRRTLVSYGIASHPNAGEWKS